MKSKNIPSEKKSKSIKETKEEINDILNKLKEGFSIALVSDAGLPLISDPGEILIDKARINDIEVICIPGPCAALTGLVSSVPVNSNLTSVRP